MIRHVFKMIWNRKRANALIMLELLITFLILFALAGFSLNLLRLYGKPLGFETGNTWSVSVETGGAWAPEDNARFLELASVAGQFDEVVEAEYMSDLPFVIGGSSGDVTVGDVYMPEVVMVFVSQDFPEAVGMQLAEGRWFGPEDDAGEATNERITPVVVNRAFSDLAGGDLVGKLLPIDDDHQRRVVGVFEEFRHHGQFSAIQPTFLSRVRSDGDLGFGLSLVLVLKPGVTAVFEEQLMASMQRVAPDWDFEVTSWDSLQDSHFRLYIIPLLIVSVLVLFLLVMVGFGLLGVLWQNVIRRTPELGVRRAMGASAGTVRLQVVLELIAVALFTLVLGIALVAQLPLAGLIPALNWTLFVPAVITSTLVLLLLCILFALYPSYQATRKDPVEALRYE